MIVAFIPAAGQSSRMRGRDKLLEDVGGQPLLRDRATIAIKAGLRVVIGLRPDDVERRAALEDLTVEVLPIFGAENGLGTTIAAGAGHLSADPEVMGILILPADMPGITSEDLTHLCSVWRRHPDQILRGATQTGTAGHPVIFPRRCFPALCKVGGSDGARDVLDGEDVILAPLPNDHATLDLDTPEDWAAWRAKMDS